MLESKATSWLARKVSCVLCCLALSIASSSVLAQRARRSTDVAPSPTGAPQLNAAARAAMQDAATALQGGALPAAERAARQAVSAAPRSAAAHNLLGIVLDQSGRGAEGNKEFNAALRLDPNFVSALNNLARNLAQSGRIREAIAKFERVLELDPGHVQAHYNLGALYGDEGNFAKAAEHFAEARKLAPDDDRLALAFVDVAYRANRSAEADAAAALLERSVGDDSRGLFTLATVLAQSGQYEHAMRVFDRVNQLTPHTYEVLYNLGIALYNLDRNDEAAKFLAEAADLNPAPAETHLRLALIASARNDWTNAVIEFKHVLEREGKNASYHYLLAREYFRVGYWEGAISEYTRAVELEPKQVAYVLARADAYYRKGEWTASAEDFDRAAQLDPNTRDIEYWQGFAHRAAGDFDGAREYLDKFVAKNPDHVDALASLGYVAIEQGRFEDAEGPLKRALALEPGNVPVMYDYARLAIKQRNFAESVTRLQRVVARSPSFTAAYYQLFLANVRLKQPEQAQTALAEFKRLDALEKESTKERMADEKLRIQQMLSQSPP